MESAATQIGTDCVTKTASAATRLLAFVAPVPNLARKIPSAMVERVLVQ